MQWRRGVLTHSTTGRPVPTIALPRPRWLRPRLAQLPNGRRRGTRCDVSRSFSPRAGEIDSARASMTERILKQREGRISRPEQPFHHAPEEPGRCPWVAPPILSDAPVGAPRGVRAPKMPQHGSKITSGSPRLPPRWLKIAEDDARYLPAYLRVAQDGYKRSRNTPRTPQGPRILQTQCLFKIVCLLAFSIPVGCCGLNFVPRNAPKRPQRHPIVPQKVPKR